MTDIEAKALALVNEVSFERVQRRYASLARLGDAKVEALCRAIEQHEAFKQKVSDAVEKAQAPAEITCRCMRKHVVAFFNRLDHLVIDKPKPDPLVEVLDKMLRRRFIHPLPDVLADEAHWLRAALDALGFEIREKNDD